MPSRAQHGRSVVGAREYRQGNTVTNFDDLGTEVSVDNVQTTESKTGTKNSSSVVQNNSSCEEHYQGQMGSGGSNQNKRTESSGLSGNTVRRSLSKEFASHVVISKESNVSNTVPSGITVQRMVQGVEFSQMPNMVIYVYSTNNP